MRNKKIASIIIWSIVLILGAVLIWIEFHKSFVQSCADFLNKEYKNSCQAATDKAMEKYKGNLLGVDRDASGEKIIWSIKINLNSPYAFENLPTDQENVIVIVLEGPKEVFIITEIKSATE